MHQYTRRLSGFQFTEVSNTFGEKGILKSAQRYKCECKPGQDRNGRRRRRRRFYEEEQSDIFEVVHVEQQPVGRYRRSIWYVEEGDFVPGPSTNPGVDRCGNTNECLSGNHYCSENAVCQDTVGSYLCHCQAGYQVKCFSMRS